MQKTSFLTEARLPAVTDIRYGTLDGQPGRIAVVGPQGALLVDNNARDRQWVAFDTAVNDRVVLVRRDRGGTLGFLNRGSWSGPVVLFDRQGKKLWSYSGPSGVDDAAMGDLDGDGSAEVVVGFNGGDGVHLVDKEGTKLWRQPDGNVWHVEIVDTEGDGQPRIVHSNAAGRMTIRDRQGRVVRSQSPGVYFSDFSIVTWTSAGKSTPRILQTRDGGIRLLDFQGSVVATWPAPEAGALGTVYGSQVTFNKGMRCFAAIVDSRRGSSSILYVYDATGKLVYQEVLPSHTSGIAAVPLGNGETEGLLVGGNGRVWMYRHK